MSEHLGLASPSARRPPKEFTDTDVSAQHPLASAPEDAVASPGALRRKPKRPQSHGVLSDMLLQDNDVYHDILQYVLMHGGPGVGFEDDDIEGKEKDPLGPHNIAMTLTKSAARLLEDSTEINFPHTTSGTTTGAQLNSNPAIPASPASSPSSGAFSNLPASPLAQTCRGTFSDPQREHFDDLVYFVTVATTPASIDNVLEDIAFHRHKKQILDALLYGLSVMCRFPVSSQSEDETGRPIREVMVQGIANVFVNLDMLCDLSQVLSATRGARICDIIRWCVGTRKQALLNLSLGLVFRLVVVCFPRLPADFTMAVAECVQHADAVRRTYCGYDDCGSMVEELGAIRAIEASFDAFKDMLFLLDEAQCFFLQPRAPSTALLPPEERLRMEQKQHPWMVAGPARELHYIAAVCYKTLELWLGISTSAEKELLHEETSARAAIDGAMNFSWESLSKADVEELRFIQHEEQLKSICLRMHERELDARREIEETYAQRVQSIGEDLRRLNWHAQQAHKELASRGATPSLYDGVRPLSSCGGARAMPRFYFLESPSLVSIESIELEYRQETVRQERYAFSAVREMWNMDFQWVKEILAEQVHEAVLRQEFLLEQKRKAYHQRKEEEEEMSYRASGGPSTRMSYLATPAVTFNPSDASRAGTSLGGRASEMLGDALAQERTTAGGRSWGTIGVASVPASNVPSRMHFQADRSPSKVGVPVQLMTNTHGSPQQMFGSDRACYYEAASNAIPMDYVHTYGNPHSTAPSSLGFGPDAPTLIRPDSIMQPSSVYRGTGEEGSPLIQTRGGGDAQRIVVSALVVSPLEVRTARQSSFFTDGFTISDSRESVACDPRSIFLGMLQDFLDDEEIERGLVEEEEGCVRKHIERQLREGRMVQFDWSMNGYRRLISTYSSSPSAASVRATPSRSAGASRALYAAGQRDGGRDVDAERHLPAFLKSSNVSRVGSSCSPLPTYSRQGQRSVALDYNNSSSCSPYPQLCPHPPSGGTRPGVSCPPVAPGTFMRPTSRLLEDILQARTTPTPRYGATGSYTPNPMFLPRRQQRV